MMIHKALCGFLILSLLLTGCGGGGGEGGGEGTGSPGNEPTSPDIAGLPPNEGVVGASVLEHFGSLDVHIAALEKHFNEDLTGLTPEAENYLAAIFEATNLAVAASQGITENVLAGEEIILPMEFDGDLHTVEKVHITPESIDLIDRLLQQYEEENDTAKGNSSTLLEKAQLPGNVHPVGAIAACSGIDMYADALGYAFGGSTALCAATLADNAVGAFIFDEVPACVAMAVVTSKAVEASTAQIACALYPKYLESLEIYPERPCVKSNSMLHPGGEIMDIVIEGHFTNKFDNAEFVKEILSKTIENYFNIADTIFAPSVKEYLADLVTDHLVDAASQRGLDLGDPILRIDGVGPVDPKFVRWEVSDEVFSRRVAGFPPLFLLSDQQNKLTSLDAGGSATIQAVVENWPTSPDEVFQSSLREVKVSTPPVLVDFNMPDEIYGDSWDFSVEDWDDGLTDERGVWFDNFPDSFSDGTIGIRDDEKDLLWAYFTDNGGGLFSVLGWDSFIYGIQTDPEVNLSYDAPFALDSTIPGPGSRAVSFHARDLCGNDVVLVENYTFNWGASCPSELFNCEPMAPESQEIYAVPEIEGLDQSLGRPYFEEAIDDLGTVGGSELSVEDGRLNFGGRDWIDILKEQDAL